MIGRTLGGEGISSVVAASACEALERHTGAPAVRVPAASDMTPVLDPLGDACGERLALAAVARRNARHR